MLLMNPQVVITFPYVTSTWDPKTLLLPAFFILFHQVRDRLT